MDKKEFSVDEEFQFGLKRLRCVKNDDCDKCFFCKVPCQNLVEYTGHCSSIHRTDKTGVAFVEVETGG